MNERETLLRRISSAQFAAWDLHMYLDTHPDDTQILKSYEKYEREARELIAKFESQFGPLVSTDVFGDNRWDWINDPWPWDIQGGMY